MVRDSLVLILLLTDGSLGVTDMTALSKKYVPLLFPPAPHFSAPCIQCILINYCSKKHFWCRDVSTVFANHFLLTGNLECFDIHDPCDTSLSYAIQVTHA